MNKTTTFIDEITKSISGGDFSKLTISNAREKGSDMKKILIKLVEIKGQLKLSFVYRYTTKDITKNFDIPEGIHIITELFAHFYDAILFKSTETVELKRTEKNEKIIRLDSVCQGDTSLKHDKEKQRMIQTQGNIYLKELGVLNNGWEIKGEMYDKFRQIDKYIQIFDNLISGSNLTKNISVVDMGAGKGYLTFAIHDYLLKNNFTPSTIGVEYRKDLVEKCNSIAKKCDFTGLHFQKGTIQETPLEKNDILIALHACDTATDDAIFKGITSGSELIICAPCCHKQIRKQFHIVNDFSSFLKHGILEERQAELITDAIRSIILEMFGYTTKVFEFISSEHTAKNIMIVAQKTKGAVNKSELYKKIQSIKSFYGIREHFLEKLLNLAEVK